VRKIVIPAASSSSTSPLRVCGENRISTEKENEDALCRRARKVMSYCVMLIEDEEDPVRFDIHGASLSQPGSSGADGTYESSALER
jgi:hypothetical protein